jgi:hypothetical protein
LSILLTGGPFSMNWEGWSFLTKIRKMIGLIPAKKKMIWLIQMTAN